MFLTALLLLSACNESLDKPDLRPPPTPEGMTSLYLDSNLMIRLDGQEVGMLDEPGVLRQSRHRKLMKALLAKDNRTIEELDESGPGFKGSDRAVHVVVDPQTLYNDLFPLLVSAAWCGWGTFHLSLYGGTSLLGPTSMDATLPAMLGEETVVGAVPAVEVRLDAGAVLGQVRFLARVAGEGTAFALARRVPHHYTLTGVRPLVDCAVAAPGQEAVCLEGQKPEKDRFPAAQTWPLPMPRDGSGFSLGTDTGCLATAPEGEEPQPPWSQQVQASLQALGLGSDAVFTVAPGAEVTARRLLDLLSAFPAAGLDLPRISPQKPPDPKFAKKEKIEKIACDAALRDAPSLAGARARWLGEQRRP